MTVDVIALLAALLVGLALVGWACVVMGGRGEHRERNGYDTR